MNKDDYEVRAINTKDAMPWIMERHYARRRPSISYSFGLFLNGEMVGICVFGRPGGACLSKGLFGGEYIKLVWELSRLFLLNNKKNEASFFISKCFKLLPSPSCVVSFSDTSIHHAGYVYQATNWIYTGLSAKRTEWVIKGMEHLHSKSIADKAKKGDGRWAALKEEYGDRLGKRDRPRKHRYVYLIGSKKEKAEMRKKLKYTEQEYPKTVNENYDTTPTNKEQEQIGIAFK